ncbi:MAG: CDP-glycerol glycerophosphotransferase family protein [Selenomonadaceae bacterium]|nr:CDP-glycerol glycerophosphotransferase family protein [Selenomonadaceae bacterium]
MEKLKVVLVVLNKKNLTDALSILNYGKVTPFLVLTADGDGKFIALDKNAGVQVLPFALIDQAVEYGKNFLWLICGQSDIADAPDKIKNFLTANGVPEKNIVNFNLPTTLNNFWFANLRAAQTGQLQAFATGDDLTARGLDFKNIHGINGVNLSAPGQDLRQSLKIARHIFKSVKRGSIKFVFIGLAPYSLHADGRKNFSTSSNDILYGLALRENVSVTSDNEKILATILGSNVIKIFETLKNEQPDLNFDKVRAAYDKKISVGDMAMWHDELARSEKIFDASTVENNLRVLEEYIKLCVDNGAKPIGILFPFATVLRENLSRENLFILRRELNRLEKIYNFTFVDMFDAQIGYDCFSDMTHLNLKGAAKFSRAVDFALCGKNFLPVEEISRLNYEKIFDVSNFLPKDIYNAALEKYFGFVVKKIRAQKQIRVGFVSDDPSMWCGDKLFNLFAENKRCETTFFLCLQKSMRGQSLVMEDFQRGIDAFKSRGINVVGITNDEQTVPKQDVLIMLRPYFNYLPKAFALSSIDTETLLTYIPYGFNMTVWNIYDTPIFHVGWKLFLDSKFHIRLLDEKCRTGMPRGIYSGYPKLDALYDTANKLEFDWKLARPDAKKIIYAPHWSIASGIFYATFQWNYKFMYEFAKAHPEISWVLKPHPNLLASAVGHGVFPSEDAFKKYLQAWDDLPNAQVFTGAYYQEIFATSDGMIMDCGSWIGEYQYTHKPMIFLTRDTQKFNALGNELMKVLYRVDGKNLNAIGALMQKVFVDGNDDMFNARMKFFDKHLNYFKANGMTASEFIFKTLSKELRLN